jgi:hypothetical protein
MANVVSTLFGVPSADILEARRIEQNQNALAIAGLKKNEIGKYIGAQIGQGLGKAGLNLLGVEDPQLKRATTIEKALAEVEASGFENPDEMYNALADKLQEAGLGREAIQARQMAATAFQQRRQVEARSGYYDAMARKASNPRAGTSTKLVQLIEARDAAEEAGDMDTVAMYDAAIAKETAPKGSSPSTDKVIAAAAQVLVDPNATPEDKAQAQKTLDTLAPFKSKLAEYDVDPNNPSVVTPKPNTVTSVKVREGTVDATKKEKELSDAEAKKYKAFDQQFAKISDMDAIIGEADKLIDQSTAGLVGKFAGKVPGTDAYNLQEKIKTIQSNLGFAELQAMRDSSPTGGALGQVAVKEIEFLQATIASLDQGQSPKQLKENLGKISKSYKRLKAALQKDKAKYGITNAPTTAEEYLNSINNGGN